MIVLGIFGGFAVLVAGVVIAELFGTPKPPARVDSRAVDIAKSRTLISESGVPRTGEYFPPPRDDRPH